MVPRTSARKEPRRDRRFRPPGPRLAGARPRAGPGPAKAVGEPRPPAPPGPGPGGSRPELEAELRGVKEEWSQITNRLESLKVKRAALQRTLSKLKGASVSESYVDMTYAGMNAAALDYPGEAVRGPGVPSTSGADDGAAAPPAAPPAAAGTSAPVRRPLKGRRRKYGKARKKLVPKATPPPAAPAAPPQPPPAAKFDGKVNVTDMVPMKEVSAEVPVHFDTAKEAIGSKNRVSLDDDMCLLPKPIFLMSDCTGESAAHMCRAALGQFEQSMGVSCPANLLIFRFVNKPEDIYEIVRRAEEENALLVYTLVEEASIKAVRTACKLHEVTHVDLWSNLLEQMEEHLEMAKLGVSLPNLQDRVAAPQRRLSPDYFRMIEAVEYTRKMDDGALPSHWKECDILLLGVSRTGKTPLSIYLGQRGYKVANLPLVPGVPVPKEAFEIDQTKVFGLVIDPAVLHRIRSNRLQNLFREDEQGNASAQSYSELKSVRQELLEANKLFGRNPTWPVLDVTLKSVEETAAKILKILSERHGPEHPLNSTYTAE